MAPAPSPVNATTWRSSGSRPRMRSIFASWSESSQKTSRASECSSTYSHSSGEFVW